MPATIEPGNQLIVFKDDHLQLRKPNGPNTYTVKAEGAGFRGGIWEIAKFLSKLSGLDHETYCRPGWATATAAIFLEPGQKATDEQKWVAE